MSLDIAIVLGTGIFSFIFAYLAVNIDKRHGALQIFYMLVSIFIMMVGFDNLHRLLNTASAGVVPDSTYAQIAGTVAVETNLIMMVAILTICYFLYMLIVAGFKVAGESKAKRKAKMEVFE